MKPSDLFEAIGRPRAYYPRLREITGTTNAALLLCQLIYWCGKQSDPQGWLFKRAEIVEEDPDGTIDPGNQSLEYETGLTYHELSVARRQLRAKGFLHERYVRSQHRVYFQLDLAAIAQAWEKMHAEHPPKARMPIDQSATGILPKRDSLIGINTDYTQTTTQSPAAAQRQSQPETHAPSQPIPTTPVEAMQRPEILLFQRVCGRFPGASQYQTVIETIAYFQDLKKEQTVEYLRRFWLAWSARKRRLDGKPYDPGSLIWLTDWALNGAIPAEFGGANEAQRGAAETLHGKGRDLSAADLDAARLINERSQQRRAGLPAL